MRRPNQRAVPVLALNRNPASISGMKVLVIGSGGREHALVWKLAQSPRAAKIWCAPGNAGIAGERLARTGQPVELADIAAENLAELLAFARQHLPELTVVGPDNPLALGIVDLFQRHGLKIWGPNQLAAQFESSKVFSQKFMERYGIPCARSGIFDRVEPARKFAEELGGRCAVKADGLALGKGVLICTDPGSAASAIDEMLVQEVSEPPAARLSFRSCWRGLRFRSMLCATARLPGFFQRRKTTNVPWTGIEALIPAEWAPTLRRRS